MDDDDWMIAAGKFKNELKSDVNSRLKSDLISDIDFSYIIIVNYFKVKVNFYFIEQNSIDSTNRP